MQLETLVIWLVIGAVAGLLAGLVVKGGGFGLFGDIVVGIVGAFFGGWLLPRLGINLGVGLVPIIVSATIGAVVLLLLLRLVRRL
ncbi:MAG TPA: GlsB/YeaQ/YmgE family stress response membrane protein [Rhizomicrobium sp.]